MDDVSLPGGCDFLGGTTCFLHHQGIIGIPSCKVGRIHQPYLELIENRGFEDDLFEYLLRWGWSPEHFIT